MYLQLIDRCRQKDRRAQSALFEACYGFLLPVCRRYARCEDDAQVMLNEGFYKVLRKLNRYSADVPFEAWCKRVVINTAIDCLRRDRSYRRAVRLTPHEQFPEAADRSHPFDLPQQVEAEDVYRWLRKLPRVTAEVFNLYAFDGYKHREIAKLLGMSEGTSKWHYAEARKRLRVLVEQHPKTQPQHVSAES